MAWNLQQINNANGNGPTVAGEYVATNGPATISGALSVSAFNNQQHFTYVDQNLNIQDAWYDGDRNQWNLQQINTGNGPTIAGEYIATNGPAIWGRNIPPFVSVYNNQQHFTYPDQNGNIQDAWWDGNRNQWNLQQINNANGNGPTVAGEYVATDGPTTTFQWPDFWPGPFVSVYNNQQHFTYLDQKFNIQDAWYDGDSNQWNLQQINYGRGPTIAGEYIATNGPVIENPNITPFVSVYNNQQHFAYLGQNDSIQDAWWDGDSNQWNLQQINYGRGPTIAGEYVATSGPAADGQSLSVSVYNNQQHFVYLDGNNNIQDAWWDGDGNQWNLQQINNVNGAGPTIAGEYVATNGPPAVGQIIFVSVYNNQQHFAYLDENGNIQDAWYDGDSNQWNLQQINNANGNGPTIAGEYVATDGPAAVTPPFVSVYNNQQHFVYLDGNGNLQDAWWDGG